MDVVVDGSYSKSIPDQVSAGIMMIDKTGFIKEKHHKTKHIEAGSTFAEWFAIEKAIDEIYESVESIKGFDVNVYTDYADAVRTLSSNTIYVHDEDVPFKNRYLQSYIRFITEKIMLLNTRFIEVKKEPININFYQVQYNSDDVPDYIIRLHKRAHKLAGLSTSKVKRRVNQVRHNKPVRLKIFLKSFNDNDRKWVLSENDKILYTGKLKKIIVRYHNERYNIISLMENKQLRVDRETNGYLMRFLPSLTE